jgi:hypothetical protein
MAQNGAAPVRFELAERQSPGDSLLEEVKRIAQIVVIGASVFLLSGLIIFLTDEIVIAIHAYSLRTYGRFADLVPVRIYERTWFIATSLTAVSLILATGTIWLAKKSSRVQFRVAAIFLFVAVCGAAVFFVPQRGRNKAGDIARKEVSNQIQALDRRLQTLDQVLAAVSKQSSESYGLKLMDDLRRTAYLNPGMDGYTTIETDVGILTVRLSDVQEYASGSRVTLLLGNLTSAEICGVHAKLEWGKVDEHGSAQSESLHSREITLAQDLLPATWGESQIILEGIAPKELGFVRVMEISHTSIKLHPAPKKDK